MPVERETGAVVTLPKELEFIIAALTDDGNMTGLLNCLI